MRVRIFLEQIFLRIFWMVSMMGGWLKVVAQGPQCLKTPPGSKPPKSIFLLGDFFSKIMGGCSLGPTGGPYLGFCEPSKYLLSFFREIGIFGGSSDSLCFRKIIFGKNFACGQNSMILTSSLSPYYFPVTPLVLPCHYPITPLFRSFAMDAISQCKMRAQCTNAVDMHHIPMQHAVTQCTNAECGYCPNAYSGRILSLPSYSSTTPLLLPYYSPSTPLLLPYYSLTTPQHSPITPLLPVSRHVVGLWPRTLGS